MFANFPKIWAFALGISCVYTHGMRGAGARHANGAVMVTITATPPASCTACHYSPTTTTLGKKNLPSLLLPSSPRRGYAETGSAPLSSKNAKISQNLELCAGISCVYTHGMRGASARHANGAVMVTISATPPACCTACHYFPPPYYPRAIKKIA